MQVVEQKLKILLYVLLNDYLQNIYWSISVVIRWKENRLLQNMKNNLPFHAVLDKTKQIKIGL